VLDAQNFGVAQRRRRVFVVGCLGDWRPAAEVLFESESLSGDFKPSRKTRKGIASYVESSFGQYREDVISGTIKASGGVAAGGSETFITHCVETFPTLLSSTAGVSRPGNEATEHQTYVAYAMQGNLIGRDKGGPEGIGVSDRETMYTLTKADVHGVAFGWQNSASQSMSVDTITPTLDKSKTPAVALLQQPIPEYYAHQYCQDRVYSTEGITPALNCSQAHKFRFDMAVRRLTPVECERLQGFPDNYTNIKDKCPDGPRYKAMGNSMAVPVMRWIGERIQMVENDYS
jgi:DNA (cytosine-5)-methyltransferase 1